MAKRDKQAIIFNKSYVLGEELEISGTFLYDGIGYLKNIDHDDPKHNVELFLSFYHLAVGIERIIKVLILLRSTDTEKTKTHRTDILIKKFERLGISIEFTEQEEEALKALSNFYEKVRYERLTFNLTDIMNNTEEFEYIAKLGGYENAPKTIKDISKKFYNKIKGIAEQEGLFTYGIRPDSKSFKIFN